MQAQLRAKTAIYLDANAALPPSHQTIAELTKECALGEAFFANPSSVHSFGRFASAHLSKAQSRIAQSIGARAQDLILTSSGTEALQTVIFGVLERALTQKVFKPVWITTQGEHAAVRECESWFEQRGGLVYRIPLSPQGSLALDAGDLEQFLSQGRRTVLVSLLWVNNETGAIIDLQAILNQLPIKPDRSHYCPMVLVDGCQAWGKIPIHVDQLKTWGVHALGLSGAKIGGLLGTGVLWVTPEKLNDFDPQFLGSQQSKRRGGSENVLGAVALGLAAQSLMDPTHWKHVSEVEHSRDALQAALESHFGDIEIRAHKNVRVGNTLNIGFKSVKKPGLVQALDLMGIAVSSGSACSSGVEEPSATLLAMGVSQDLARSAVRISLAKPLENEQIQVIVKGIQDAVQRFRAKNS